MRRCGAVSLAISGRSLRCDALGLMKVVMVGIPRGTDGCVCLPRINGRFAGARGGFKDEGCCHKRCWSLAIVCEIHTLSKRHPLQILIQIILNLDRLSNMADEQKDSYW